MNQHLDGNENGAAPLKSRRRINWDNPHDVQALVIASMGFSNNCVQQYTGLSAGQISYRLRLAGMSGNRRDFRDGKGAIAKAFIRTNSNMVEGRIEKSLRKAHQTQPVLAPLQDMTFFVLNEKREPVQVLDIQMWAVWYENTTLRRIGSDYVGNVYISTVFLGMPHPGGMWETMIFGGPHDQSQWRYHNFEQAEAGHAAAVKLVEKGRRMKTKKPKKPKPPVKATNTFYCRCQPNVAMTGPEAVRHLKEVHKLDDMKGTKNMVLHLDGQDYFTSQYVWSLRGVVLDQTVCNPRTKATRIL